MIRLGLGKISSEMPAKTQNISQKTNTLTIRVAEAIFCVRGVMPHPPLVLLACAQSTAVGLAPFG